MRVGHFGAGHGMLVGALFADRERSDVGDYDTASNGAASICGAGESIQGAIGSSKPNTAAVTSKLKSSHIATHRPAQSISHPRPASHLS